MNIQIVFRPSVPELSHAGRNRLNPAAELVTDLPDFCGFDIPSVTKSPDCYL